MKLIGISKQRLQQALQMAITDLEEGHAPDPFRYSDYDLEQPAFLRRVETNLRRGLFRPNTPLELSFPKSEFAVRPGRRIELEDLVVLYYVLIALVGDLEDKLKPGVTAYRVRKGRPPQVILRTTYILPKYLRRRLRLIQPWYNAWPWFIRRLRWEYSKHGRKYLGLSDITSFYEDVDLTILRAVLRDRVRKENRPLVNLLVEMYQTWSSRDVHLVRQNRGLPQGTMSSGVVANYYLMPFDETINEYAQQRNLRWYRYSDDMRLLGADRERVRFGLREVGQQLARLNLIQQAAKTKIITGTGARKELFDLRPEKISHLIGRVQKKPRLPLRTRNAMLRLLDRVLSRVQDFTDKNDSRVLALLYGAYGALRSDRLLRRWKRDYLQQPSRAQTILSYLSLFLDRRGRCRQLISTIAGQRGRATDWELAQLLRALRRARSFPTGSIPLLRALALTQTVNWYVRQQAILCIGWFRLSAEARRLARILDTEWDDEVRRSILTVLFLLSPKEETALLRNAARDLSPKVSRMANFLLRLRSDQRLAQFNLRKFRTPNDIFFSDSFWRLYQIRWQRDPNSIRALRAVLSRTQAQLMGKILRLHVRALLVGFFPVGPTVARRKTKPPIPVAAALAVP